MEIKWWKTLTQIKWWEILMQIKQHLPEDWFFWTVCTLSFFYVLHLCAIGWDIITKESFTWKQATCGLEEIGLLLLYVLLHLAVYYIIASLVFKFKYRYWRNKRVQYMRPKWPYGNIHTGYDPQGIILTFALQLNSCYTNFRIIDEPHAGIYILWKPVWMPLNPRLITAILTVDSEYFSEKEFYADKRNPFSARLFALDAIRWRWHRKWLNRAYFRIKAYDIFNSLLDCDVALEEAINAQLTSAVKRVDIKEVCSRFATGIVGSCAFGLEFNTIKEVDSTFRSRIEEALQPSMWRSFKTFIAITFPNLSNFLNVRPVPKDVSDYFSNLVEETINFREEHQILKKDFMQELIKFHCKPGQCEFVDCMTNEEKAAQCFVFFLAAFETLSATLTFLLLELSINTNIQDKVREDINTVLAEHDGKFSFKAIKEMSYLTLAVKETLRKFPPRPYLHFTCVEEYDVDFYTELLLKKGTECIIPIMGLHYDPDYYPDPHSFIPERMTDENDLYRPPNVYLPFGGPHRKFLGSRFGKMLTKIGAVILLRKYKFSMNSNYHGPLNLTPDFVGIASKKAIWLEVEEIPDVRPLRE